MNIQQSKFLKIYFKKTQKNNDKDSKSPSTLDKKSLTDFKNKSFIWF